MFLSFQLFRFAVLAHVALRLFLLHLTLEPERAAAHDALDEWVALGVGASVAQHVVAPRSRFRHGTLVADALPPVLAPLEVLLASTDRATVELVEPLIFLSFAKDPLVVALREAVVT